VAFASLITIFLNLDTTAVLRTPVMLALAGKARIAALVSSLERAAITSPASGVNPIVVSTQLCERQEPSRSFKRNRSTPVDLARRALGRRLVVRFSSTVRGAYLRKAQA
jgi:hypothetical protein